MPLIPTPHAVEAKGEAQPAKPDSERASRIVQAIEGCYAEAKNAREGGLNPRDPKWAEILDLYWNRYDFSGKADWQAKETLPEVPTFIDRFAAAMKEAWIAATAANSYTIVNPADPDDDLSPALKRMMDVWLSACGRAPGGHPLGFESVVEDQVKLGSLMKCAGVVTWRRDWAKGRVAIETVDPRSVYLDHTYRGMYRVRDFELDRHAVDDLVKERDRRGRPVYQLAMLDKMRSSWDSEGRADADELTGTAQETISNRRTVCLREFYGDIVLADGTVEARNALAVVADGRWLIRGPEPNPFWHGRDWVVAAPLIRVPGSVDGKAYAEDFGSLARTYNKLTNLLLDAVFTSSLKVFAIVPEMLRDPNQAARGLAPGMTFNLQYGVGKAQDFMHVIDLGNMPSESISVWQALKNGLTEAAGQNEVGLGQFAPNSRTSATEISETQQSSSALVRSAAQTFETWWLEPVLTLAWKTGVQHMDRDDLSLQRAAGPEMFAALIKRRKELIEAPISFQARGISSLIAKGQKLRSLMQVLQVVASNEILLQQFMQVADMGKLLELMFDLSNIDIKRITVGEREQALNQIMPAFQAGMQPGRGSAPQGAADVARQMGVGRS